MGIRDTMARANRLMGWAEKIIPQLDAALADDKIVMVTEIGPWQIKDGNVEVQMRIGTELGVGVVNTMRIPIPADLVEITGTGVTVTLPKTPQKVLFADGKLQIERASE